MWLEYYGYMDGIGLLTASDSLALEALARATVAWRNAAQKVRNTGEGYTAESTTLKDLRLLLNDFGLTPSSKAKLGILKAKEKSLDEKESEKMEAKLRFA